MSQQGHWYKDGAPPLDQPVEPPPGMNGLGIAGFVVGIISVCGCAGLLSPIGLLLSVFGLFRKPRGWAVAGTIISALGCCCLLPIGLPMLLVATGAISVSALVIWVGNTFNMGPAGKTALHAAVIGAMISAQYGASQKVPASLDTIGLEAPVLKDGWGNPFEYKITDTGGFILRSFGGDGAPDTGDDFVMEGVPNAGGLTIVTPPRGARGTTGGAGGASGGGTGGGTGGAESGAGGSSQSDAKSGNGADGDQSEPAKPAK